MELRKIGRPLKIKSPEEMERILNEYFSNTPENKITITGICLALDLDKNNFYDYGKRKGYENIVKRARMIVENSYELSLRENGRTGDIFALKNFGWVDKQEQEVTTTARYNIINDLPKGEENE